MPDTQHYSVNDDPRHSRGIAADQRGADTPTPRPLTSDEVAEWIEQLQADLAERTTERDAADAVIRRTLTAVPSLIWTDDEGDSWLGLNALTPAEAEALRRARAAQEGS